MPAFQTRPVKRQRDDDSDSDDDRYLKKSRTWTLNHSNYASTRYPSPPQRPGACPSPPRVAVGLGAITPAESDHGNTHSSDAAQDEPDMIMSPHHDFDVDAMHMDDDDELDMVHSQPPDSPFVTSFRPAKLNLELFSRDSTGCASATGRIPTPIYPSFASNSLHNSTVTSNGFLGVQSSVQPPTQPQHRRQQSQGGHERSIRMPSPISEDEDIPDTPTAFTQSQLSRLSVTNHHASDRMDAEMSPPVLAPSRGRKRSGALTGIGRFSMGYRDDCEKCRLRVPGHYSHFLP